jgi:hypothetical protein
LAGTGVLWGGGFGGCVPDNFLVNKNGEIVNGLIISVLNLLLAPTGIVI